MRQGIFKLTKGDIRKFKEWLKIKGFSEVRLKSVNAIRMYKHGPGYLLYCFERQDRFVTHYRAEGISYSYLKDWFRECR